MRDWRKDGTSNPSHIFKSTPRGRIPRSKRKQRDMEDVKKDHRCDTRCDVPGGDRIVGEVETDAPTKRKKGNTRGHWFVTALGRAKRKEESGKVQGRHKIGFRPPKWKSRQAKISCVLEKSLSRAQNSER